MLFLFEIKFKFKTFKIKNDFKHKYWTIQRSVNGLNAPVGKLVQFIRYA